MTDKQILIFELTSYCNSKCEDCLRASMNKTDYMMSYDEVIKSLNEVKKFSTNFDCFELKLSGGEPTIWKNNGYDIIDIISECEKRNMKFALVSNGKVFEKYSYCEMFFDKLKANNVNKLKIYITIDNFHKNYTGLENNILDNLLKINEIFDVDLYVQSTITKRKEDNLSKEFVDKYFKRGVKFIMNPLLPWGRGKNLDEIVPYLYLDKNDKQDLGDYLKYYYILGKSKGLWNTYEEYIGYNNVESIKKLNCCGKTITFMEGKYYYCMPLSDKEEFVFANLGELTFEKYMNFINSSKHINNMKNNKFNIDPKFKKTPIGYGVCALCRNMYERGNCCEICNNKHE